MSDSSGGFVAFVKEHPLPLALAVGAVALLAWWRSRQSAQAASVAQTTSTGPTLDPNAVLAYETAQGANAAQIQQATVAAGAQNLGVLAQLISATEGNKASESAALASNANATAAQEYNQQVAGVSALNQVRAALAASLGQVAAQRDTSLAQTNANEATTLAATQAGLTENATTMAAQTAIAQISASTQQAGIAANTKAAELQSQTQLQLGQYQKDIARAKDNTSIIGSIIGGVASIFGL